MKNLFYSILSKIPDFEFSIFEIEYFYAPPHPLITFLIRIGKIEYGGGFESSLIEIGWHDNVFYWDFLYFSALKRGYKNYKEKEEV